MFQFVIDLVFGVFFCGHCSQLWKCSRLPQLLSKKMLLFFLSGLRSTAHQDKNNYKNNLKIKVTHVGNLELLMHSYAVNAHRSLLCLSRL